MNDAVFKLLDRPQPPRFFILKFTSCDTKYIFWSQESDINFENTFIQTFKSLVENKDVGLNNQVHEKCLFSGFKNIIKSQEFKQLLDDKAAVEELIQ